MIMAHSGMMICSFYLRYARTDKDYYLNDLHKASVPERAFNNVIEMIEDFCAKYQKYADDLDQKKLFSVDKSSINHHNGKDFQALSFTIRSGSYGIVSEITDRTTQRVNYRRKQDDADIKDFKCVVFVPKDVGDQKIYKGIMVFQTIATYGIKTITTTKMRDYFSHLGLTLDIRSVSVRAFIQKLRSQGKMYKVTLIKNKISSDAADNIFITKGREEITYIKPQIRDSWFNGFLDWVDRTSDPESNVFEIEDQQYEDVKITFQINGNYRTIALRYIDRISIVEDLPDTIYDNGQFDEIAIVNYMLQAAKDYKDKMIMSK